MSKGERLESAICNHYQLVDDQRWNELRAAYAREAEYQRGTRLPMKGAAAIDRFYRSERIIAGGRHTITTLVINRVMRK